MNIYFVCTGNTCRSPMAEAILKHQNRQNVFVKSAGIYAREGSAMSANAQVVLTEHNISTEHASAAISQEDIEWADIILTMTGSHKQIILQIFEEAENKTYTLMEYISKQNHIDIMDPFGGDIQVYREIFEQLAYLIAQLRVEQGDDIG